MPDNPAKSMIRKVYDPCCGTGGMLTTARDHIVEINQSANVYLYGPGSQQRDICCLQVRSVHEEPWMGAYAENILFGSTLTTGPHERETLYFIFANPPYGKDWKRDEEAVKLEAEKGAI